MEDELLAAAIAVSITDQRGAASGHFQSTRFRVNREDVRREDRHLPAEIPRGELLQLNWTDQFSVAWDALIAKYNTPSAICGYLSVAVACVLATRSECKQPAEVDVLGIIDTLTAVDHPAGVATAVVGEVERMMAWLQQARLAWIAAHASAFPTAGSRQAYLRAWVANYEISDYLITRPDVTGAGSRYGTHRARATVRFMRFNEWPEHAAATHEERERLRECERFGGARGDKSSAAVYGERDSVFIVEEFAPARRLLSPDEWSQERQAPVAAAEAAGGITAGGERGLDIVILDLNGHFAAAVACPAAAVPVAVPVPAPAPPGGGGGGGGWACVVCTYLNLNKGGGRAACEMCGSACAASSPAAAAPVPPPAPVPSYEGEGAEHLGRTLVMLNTTAGSYLGGSGGMIASFAFDTAAA
jgi:hypothetical protein